MKNYKLSDENKKIEIKYKKDIENNTIRRDRIYDKIKKLNQIVNLHMMKKDIKY